MTDEWIPRGDRKLKNEELYPQGARQKTIVGKIQYILEEAGMLPGTAYEKALKIWRITRRG